MKKVTGLTLQHSTVTASILFERESTAKAVIGVGGEVDVMQFNMQRSTRLYHFRSMGGSRSTTIMRFRNSASHSSTGRG